MASINEITLEGNTCIELTAGDYLAVLAPSIGNNMIRLRDNAKQIEIFHYNAEHPYTTVAQNPEIYGYPFLYLPNRLGDGVLNTSDATYHLPVNEPGPFYNALHGFVHKRAYTVVEQTVINDDAVRVVSEYKYGENDEYYQYFPVSFTLRMTYTLSANDGLLQEVEMTNTSEHQLPCGFCSHTPFNVPFVDGTNEADYTVCVPVKERWEITNRCLPTEKIHPLTEYDERYNKGTMPCAGRNLDNDLYTAQMNTLNGEDFYGAYATHMPSGQKICYEVSSEYGFWCIWNDRGVNGYFCPEPCTWMINAPNLTLPAEKTGYVEIAPEETFACWQHIFTA
jgi:aldose 1-epimerase